METIENLRERLEALENQAQDFAKQIRAAERRLHCWRKVAYGSLIVGLSEPATVRDSARRIVRVQGG